MLFKWNYKPPTSDEKRVAKELGEKLNINQILAYLLIRRGITTESGAKRFFHPQLADLNNPFLMKDMDVAVDRLNDAMGRKERILVYGDYDVDGCTAVALVYRFLQQFYSNIEYYIPNRYNEGYGVSKIGIDYAHENGIKLIIILDCGIKAVEEVAYAKSLGIDFIICDHHVPDDVLPPAVAILNPKRADDSYPFKHLCGCGVGFKLMQAFAKNNGIPFSRLIPLLDLCAESIAADIVPVVEENRILVKDHGRGIPPEEIPRITEAFYMVDKSRSKKAGGIGLGLALCSQIVKLHGARLEIRSKLGVGTEISVIFPEQKKREEKA